MKKLKSDKLMLDFLENSQLKKDEKLKYTKEFIENSLKSILNKLDLSRVNENNLSGLCHATKLLYKTFSDTFAFKLNDRIKELTKCQYSDEKMEFINKKDEFYDLLDEESEVRLYKKDLAKYFSEKLNININLEQANLLADNAKNCKNKIFEIGRKGLQNYINNLGEKSNISRDLLFSNMKFDKETFEQIYKEYNDTKNKILNERVNEQK